MKTSKIKEVISIKPFENNYGKTFYHDLVMENGDKINIGKKSECQVGWELTYELTGEDDGQQEYMKAKSVQKEGGYSKKSESDNDRQTSIVRQTCVKAACELLSGTTRNTPEVVIEYAEKLEEWVNR